MLRRWLLLLLLSCYVRTVDTLLQSWCAFVRHRCCSSLISSICLHLLWLLFNSHCGPSGCPDSSLFAGGSLLSLTLPSGCKHGHFLTSLAGYQRSDDTVREGGSSPTIVLNCLKARGRMRIWHHYLSFTAKSWRSCSGWLGILIVLCYPLGCSPFAELSCNFTVVCCDFCFWLKHYASSHIWIMVTNGTAQLWLCSAVSSSLET